MALTTAPVVVPTYFGASAKVYQIKLTKRTLETIAEGGAFYLSPKVAHLFNISNQVVF